jgi:hypothetical protein
MTPTLVTSCTTLPPKEAGPAWGGPGLGLSLTHLALVIRRTAPKDRPLLGTS